jgi:dTDP-4-dehydrorhamnose reductase
MRLLITGAAGMLGRDVTEAAAAAGHEVVALGRTELDVTDRDETLAAIGGAAPQCVINCAAYTDVAGAESQPELAHAVNVDGARHVAAAAAQAGAWLVHVSTDYVFAGDKRTPYLESDPAEPACEYGRSKLAGERVVAELAPEAHTTVRSSWLFGAHGKSFPGTIARLAGEREQLTVVDDQVGCPTFTRHLATALVILAGRRPLGTVHVSAGGHCSWYEFALQIVARSGHTCEVLPVTTADLGRPAPRPAYSVLGTERGEDAPRLPDWRDGLDAFMDLVVVS